jgi:hypothetical protein|tara:strand:- start:2651 stop:2809 length:159 start_codon:yes stop_codon:yes gene_type:complete
MSQKAKKIGSKKSAKRMQRVKTSLYPTSRWNERKIYGSVDISRLKKFVKNAM